MNWAWLPPAILAGGLAFYAAFTKDPEMTPPRRAVLVGIMGALALAAVWRVFWW